MLSPTLFRLSFVITFFMLSKFKSVYAVVSYANDFVDPNYIVLKQYPPNTSDAQATIVSWAQSLASEGPWCESGSLQLSVPG